MGVCFGRKPSRRVAAADSAYSAMARPADQPSTRYVWPHVVAEDCHVSTSNVLAEANAAVDVCVMEAPMRCVRRCTVASSSATQRAFAKEAMLILSEARGLKAAGRAVWVSIVPAGALPILYAGTRDECLCVCVLISKTCLHWERIMTAFHRHGLVLGLDVSGSVMVLLKVL
jgi:hypothetical protein